MRRAAQQRGSCARCTDHAGPLSYSRSEQATGTDVRQPNRLSPAARWASFRGSHRTVGATNASSVHAAGPLHARQSNRSTPAGWLMRSVGGAAAFSQSASRSASVWLPISDHLGGLEGPVDAGIWRAVCLQDRSHPSQAREDRRAADTGSPTAPKSPMRPSAGMSASPPATLRASSRLAEGVALALQACSDVSISGASMKHRRDPRLAPR